MANEGALLTYASWTKLDARLGTDRAAAAGRAECRPVQDNRPYFEGMMWMARTGPRWGHLHHNYGKWNSVLRRYRLP
ncbi:MAG: transposase [Mesorhizobium sp.]|nr:MAG: transposase [Mesorhizobium sp.]